MCEKYLDDRVVIPENIKRMSKEELDREIEKFEKELKSNKPHKFNT